MKILTVCCLVACSSSPQSKPEHPWFAQWDAARACLVSGAPHREIADAIAATRVLGRACEIPSPPVGGAGENWRRIADGVAELASDPDGSAAAKLVAAIDVEVAELRGVAPPPPLPPLHLLAPGAAYLVDGKPLGEYDMHSFEPPFGRIDSGIASTYFWERGDRVEHVTHPNRPRWISGSSPALPTGRWSVSNESVTSALELAEGSQIRSVVLPVATRGYPAAIDAKPLRLVVSKAQTPDRHAFLLSISPDDGASWRSVPFGEGRRAGLAQDRMTGTIDAYTLRSDNALVGYRFEPEHAARYGDALAAPVVVALDAPFDLNGFSCWANEVVWIASPDGLFRSDGRKVSIVRKSSRKPSVRVVRCSRTHAIVDFDAGLHHCDAKRCTPIDAPVTHEEASAVLPDGSWLVAKAQDGVVAIWRQGHDAELFRLTEPGAVRGARVVGDTLHLAIASVHGLRFVPARELGLSKQPDTRMAERPAP